MVSLAVNGSIQTWLSKRAWLPDGVQASPGQTEGADSSSPRFSGSVSRSRTTRRCVGARGCSARSCGFRKLRALAHPPDDRTSTGLRIHVLKRSQTAKAARMAQVAIGVDRETGNIVASELGPSGARDADPSPRFANTDSSTSSVGGGSTVHTTRKRSTKPSKRTVLERRTRVSDSAATKRRRSVTNSNTRHAGARSPYSCNRKTRPT